jgi:3'-phosphoadenosine 5'-phosphosulfate sulfotransferase (PAPS reductase)/FAD synthetase
MNTLKYKQNLDLETKILISNKRIFDWYIHNHGRVYVAFSGGKDSTVLLDLVRKQFPEVPAVFCDTGLEFPEIRKFVKTIDNVIWIKPRKSFREIISNYGYPVVSKEQSQYIDQYRNAKSEKTKNTRLNGNKYNRGKISAKWKFLIDAPFKISDRCCYYMKKDPSIRYEKETMSTPFTGIMAEESELRRESYNRFGCNAYDTKRPQSRPIIFWREQDVWDYIKTKGIKYSNIYDMGYERTGCMFCMYGLNRDDVNNNRFDKMKKTHPKQHDYCMNKLGLKDVIDFVESKGERSLFDDVK